MFISDNGPHQEGGADPAFFKSSGGLRGIKRDLYEGGIRVPMIASWPGTIPKGRVSAHPWAHWDMFPTRRGDWRARRRPPGSTAVSMARALRGQSQRRARVHVLGVSRARLPAGGAHGPLEGGPALEGRAARALRSDRPIPREQRNVAAAHPDVVKKIEDYLRTARTDSARWPIK